MPLQTKCIRYYRTNETVTKCTAKASELGLEFSKSIPLWTGRPSNKSSSEDEIANVNVLRRHRTCRVQSLRPLNWVPNFYCNQGRRRDSKSEGDKTWFASGASEKKFLYPPLFQYVSKLASYCMSSLLRKKSRERGANLLTYCSRLKNW